MLRAEFPVITNSTFCRLFHKYIFNIYALNTSGKATDFALGLEVSYALPYLISYKD